MLKKYFHPLIFLIIIGLSFIIYANSFYAEFQFDDGVHIVKQESIKDLAQFSKFSSWKNINQRPLAVLTLALNYSIHELDVFGYHFLNVLIHALSAIFVFLLTRLIIDRSHPVNDFLKANSQWFALFTALIFVAHPIQTQAVTYIIQRMTSLSAMFYLGTLFFYLKGRFNQSDKKHCLTFYLLSAIFALASLLSKQIAISIPLAILLIELFFVRKADGKIFKAYVVSFAGILLLAFLFILFSGNLPRETETISRTDYLITQFRVLTEYFKLLIFPLSQNLDHDFSISSSLWGWKEITSLCFILLTFFVAKKAYKKHKLISFGIAFIYVSLLLESSIFPIRDVMVEHRLYLPMFGFSLLLVYLLFLIKHTKIVITSSIVIVLLFSGLTLSRNEVWKNPESLWSDVAKKSPNKARPYLNLGNIYFQAGNQQKALRYFNKTIELDRANWQAYFNRGQLLLYMNKPKIAERDLNQSISFKNDFAESYDTRGLAKLQMKNYQAAILDFTKAIDLKPMLESAWFNRANAKIFIKDFEGALQDYAKAIEINDEFAEALNNRGQLQYNLKQYTAALNDLNRALEINPRFVGALNNRAKTLMALGRYKTAVDDLSLSLSLKEVNPLAFRLRGLCLIELKDYEQAKIDFLWAQQLGDKDVGKYIKQIENIQFKD